MNKQPKIDLVFDRRRKAKTTGEGMLELRVGYNSRYAYISTGISLGEKQWNNGVVVGRPDAITVNRSINQKYQELADRIVSYMSDNGEFSFDALQYCKGSEMVKSVIDTREREATPFEWMKERLASRRIRENTRDNHLRMIENIKRSGIFKRWDDFTPANIMLWDEQLKKKLKRQTSVHCYHKRLKMFLKEAEIFGKIKQDPYKRVKIEAGHAEGIKYLTKEERRRIEHLELEGPEDKARDLFIFACYTGLSFCDLQKIKLEDIKRLDGQYVIEDKRQKTGTTYHIVLLPQAMNILKKYNFDLKILTNQKANWYLKSVQALAHVKTRLTMHVGRHTFATWALSEGIAIETVSKMLAHSNIQVTQIYAKVLPKSVTDAFQLLKGLA